jgi:DNA topoisomerase-1
MASHLLIVESPSKAKTLKKYLGKDFEILASYGHVRDLVPKTGAVDPEDNFKMKYELIERNTKHVDAIAKAVKDASHVLLATDPDREGEAIAWHLSEILKSRKALKDKTMKRVVFYEITEGAVKDAVKNPRAISMDLVNAQQARRALDYPVGFNLSPLLWKKIRRGLSAGRVQSPALRLIVERELEIEKFKSQEYWTIHFDSAKERIAFTAKLTHFKGEKLDQFAIGSAERDAEVRAFLDAHGKGHAKVVEIEKKRKLRSPAAPFTTSTLQQEAVRKLGFSTDRAMKVAQSLYEGVNVGKEVTGLITYMRTGLGHPLEGSGAGDARLHHQELRLRLPAEGAGFEYRASSKNAQEAHEAIPPHVDQAHAGFRGPLPERRATQALRDDLEAGDRLADDAGQVRHRRGRLHVGGAGNVSAPPARRWSSRASTPCTTRTRTTPSRRRQAPSPLRERRTVKIEKLYGEQHFTQPPPRFSKASLVKALEQYGIGRPSTYASIISTLVNREYVTSTRSASCHRRGPRREQVPHRALRALGGLRVHREARGRARRHLQRQGEWVPIARAASGRTSPPRSTRRSRCRAMT